MGKVVKFFELHGLKLLAVLFFAMLAEAGVFGQTTQSAAGVFGLLAMVAMAAVLVRQFLRAEPVLRDAVKRQLDK